VDVAFGDQLLSFEATVTRCSIASALGLISEAGLAQPCYPRKTQDIDWL
jgi:hypothetical protein